jgi:hypothetical protein
VLGALAGYGLSLIGGAGGGSDGGAQFEPSVAMIIAMGAAMGLAMGGLMGAVQWLAARQTLSFKNWVMLNMAGWAPAMAVIMFAATSVKQEFPLGLIALIGAASGGIAGLMLGAVTSRTLPSEPAFG